MIFRSTTIESVVTCIFFAVTPLVAADWQHWRGPNRDDVSPDQSGWDGQTWIDDELWKANIGEGSSSPIVVGNHVFLTGWKNNKDTIRCLDINTGKEHWRQSYQQPQYGRHSVGDKSLYSGACSTPEYDADTGYLFTLGVDGDLIAWDTRKKGAQIWSLNLYDRYQAPRRPEVALRKKTRRDYGYTSSPLVIGDQIIVEVGGNKGNLVAFNKQDGNELWTSENRDEAGHTAGPVPITVDGVGCAAVLTLRSLVVTRIDGSNAGKTIATYPWTTDFGNNIAAAAVSGNSVIITSAYNHSAMCRLDITLAGATKVWEEKGIASGVCTPIIHGGHVYWAWRGVHCVDFNTGKERWVGGKVGSQGSAVLTADDRLIVFANQGELTLVETAKRSPKKYAEVASKNVLSATDAWPHVVLSGNSIICRDRSGAVRCLSIGAN